jgi:hypothetical protein
VPDRNYIARLQNAIWQLNHCDSKYLESVLVRRTIPCLQENPFDEGEIAVFEIFDHPQAKRAYAWSYRASNNTRFVVVLEIPPVTSPQTAVEAAIAAQIANRTFH